MKSSEVVTASNAANDARRAWVTPVVHVLPRLNELTLQSPGGIPGGGGTGGGGSTVIP